MATSSSGPSTSVALPKATDFLDEMQILPTTSENENKPPPPSYPTPLVARYLSVRVHEAGGHPGEGDHQVSLQSYPMVSSSTSHVLMSSEGMMIGGAKSSTSTDGVNAPVTITLQNPDGQGEGTVVAAQVAKMIPINLPKDGRSVTKLVEVQGTVQAGHTVYQIVVEPVSSSSAQSSGIEGEQAERVIVGQVMQVAQEEGNVTRTQGTIPAGLSGSTGLAGTSGKLQVPSTDVAEPSKPLPPGCPPWASRIKDVEEIGDSYRGYVESDVELDLLLTYHKQQTGSYWGTRQSPSNERPSKRLMWKSQYVPYDGIPFINSGSRAVVMECQFGPRRKGAAAKRLDSGKKGYQVTCPARIYIKKVKKFPHFRVRVDQDADKKLVRQAQDNAFATIKEVGVDSLKGVERYYVQLPTAKAHDYHDQFPIGVMPPSAYYNKAEDILHHKPEPAVVVKEVQSADTLNIRNHSATLPVPTPPGATQKVDPKVAEKIRELVSHGIVNAYIIRQNLRNYVMHKLFSTGNMPERHNLMYFPTINNIQNHVHEALKAIEQGELVPVVQVSLADLAAMTAPPHRNSSSGTGQDMLQEQVVVLPAVSTTAGGTLQPQTVTVTLTQNPDDAEGSAIISRVETQMTDGTTRVCDTISPETAQLLSQLTPKMFTHQNITQVQETPEGTVTIQMQRLTEAQEAASELNQSETMLHTDESTINQPEGLLHSHDPSTSTLDQSGDLLEAPGPDHLGQSGSLLESDASAHVSPTDVLLQEAESTDELHQSDPLLQQEHSAIDQSEVMTHKDDGVMSELTSQAEDQASLLLGMHESIGLSHSTSDMQDDSDTSAHEHGTGESLAKRARLDVDDISDNSTLPQ